MTLKSLIMTPYSFSLLMRKLQPIWPYISMHSIQSELYDSMMFQLYATAMGCPHWGGDPSFGHELPIITYNYNGK